MRIVKVAGISVLIAFLSVRAFGVGVELVDRKGASEKESVPAWVSDAIRGKGFDLARDVGADDKTQVLVVGKKLSDAKEAEQWCENCALEEEIAALLDSAVTESASKAFGAKWNESSGKKTESRRECVAKLREAVGSSSDKFGAAEKIDSYWFLYNVTRDSGKTEKSASGYVVCTISREDFREATDNALKTISAKGNQDMGRLLKAFRMSISHPIVAQIPVAD